MMVNTIAGFLSDGWAYRLGWALLHSLWQSGIMLLFVVIALRFIPLFKSRLRYGVATCGFALLATGCMVTFLRIDDPGPAGVQAHETIIHPISFTSQPAADTDAVSDLVSLTAATIEHHMPWILMAWFAGFLFCSVRLTGGIIYIRKIRSSSVPLQNDWTGFIANAARELGITRWIALAESGRITAPMVIGYFKPVILIPVGMLTGLSTEQIQTIFLHELAHIRRQDYLVNFIQSVAEVVLFFNPFALALSAIIRREREYCCDDLVLRHHGNARAYTNALAHLAGNALSSHAFALSLGEDKNQLLNRIRRIMENPPKNRSDKNRLLVPAILLVAGLLSISWLGMEDKKTAKADPLLIERDTTIPKKEKRARYSRQSIAIDEDGQARERVVEEFEGGELSRPLLKDRRQYIPVISFAIPPRASLPHYSLLAELLPHMVPWAAYRLSDGEQWEVFSGRFEENFGRGSERMFLWRDKSGLMKEPEERFRFNRCEERSRPHFEFPSETFRYHQNLIYDHSVEKSGEVLEAYGSPYPFDAETRFIRTIHHSILQDKTVFHHVITQIEAAVQVDVLCIGAGKGSV